jgi:hypothetical protein
MLVDDADHMEAVSHNAGLGEVLFHQSAIGRETFERPSTTA